MIWDSLKYGWNVNYWLTISGIDCVFSEASVTGTPPDGFASMLKSLVIDHSAEVGQSVDRDTGMGQGLPLTFSLLSAPALAAIMQTPTMTTVLTQNCVAGTPYTGTGTLHVQDTSAFPSSGTLYVGLETFTYTGKTSITFTGCSNALHGSLASSHFYGTAGGTVTNRPRVWRGREVRLYAAPVSPDGTTTGSALADESQEVWRGFIDQGPYRDGSDRFTVEALSMDRVLANPLPCGATGVVQKYSSRQPVHQDQYLQVVIEAYNSSNAAISGYPLQVIITPFDNIPDGTLMEIADIIATIQARWDAALVDLGAPAIKLMFNTHVGDYTYNTGYFLYPSNAAIDHSVFTVVVNGKLKVDHHAMWWGPSGLGFDVNPKPIIPTWNGGANPLGGGATSNEYGQWDPSGDTGESMTLVVELDSPADAIPPYGLLTVGDETISGKATVVGNLAYFYDLRYLSPKQNIAWTPKDNAIGKTVEYTFSETSDYAYDLMCRSLESSGAGTRGDYDYWGYGDGYAIDQSAIDVASFDSGLASAIVGLNLRVGGSGLSFQDMLSGLLALVQRGVVARPDSSGRVRLGIVSTDVNGSWYKTKITDEHLLSFNSEPVVSVRKRDPVTQIKVSFTTDAKGKDSPTVYTVQETSGVLESGGQTLDLALALNGPQPSADWTIQGWCATILAQSHAVQTIEVRVVPWLDVNVGDMCRLETTHPTLWNWATASEGFTGQARCIGTRRDLMGGALTLTLVVQGGPVVSGLSPAARINWYDSSSAPTLVDIDHKFLSYMQQSISENAGAAVRLMHYQVGMGNEAYGGYLIVSAANSVTVSGVDWCRLTIASSSIAGASLSTSLNSTLTLPAGAVATGWQNMFAHAGDGTFWG